MYSGKKVSQKNRKNDVKHLGNHQLYLNKVTKKGLCNFDDKRFWLGKRVGENVSSKFENITDDIKNNNNCIYIYIFYFQ
jgi:hypothetical protein